MVQSIESFVEKIKQDGVDAGKIQADSIISQAKEEAASIVEKAKKEASATVSEAKAQAEKNKEKLQAETFLACRDLVLKLKEDLSGLFTSVLKKQLDANLSDEAFLKDIIKAMVVEYAKADAAGKELTVGLNDKMYAELESWVKGQLSASAKKVKIGARPGMAGSGFEITVGTGAAVDMTSSSLVQAIKDMVSPALKETLDQGSFE